MKISKRLALLCCLGLIIIVSCTNKSRPVSAPPLQQSERRSPEEPSDAQIPEKAITVYENTLREGRAPKGYVGGRVWENREHRLPRGGNYREFDVNPKLPGQNRGAERIVVNLDTREGWYTADHYRTFTRIERKRHDR
jgi:ribonuclease T1